MNPIFEQTPVLYCVHDDHWYLAASIRSWRPAGPVFVFVSRIAWDGSTGDWERCVSVAEAQGAQVVVGDWPNEEMHRQSALDALNEMGARFVMTPDGDEIVEPELLAHLQRIASADLADRVYVHWDTYWKDAQHVIRPRESFHPLMMLNLERTRHVFCREYEGGRALVLGPAHGIVHHLSYAGPDERIARKISTWGHRDEVLDDWWDKVWKAWDSDRLLRHLHPTHAAAYGFAEPIECPNAVRDAGVPEVRLTPLEASIEPGKVSVVIPLYGGEEDVRLCLESLSALRDLVGETIVVDNDSPDRAATIVEAFPWARLIRNDSNLGFAHACNQGLRAAGGEVVIFLNSDTVVPRAGLIRLLQTFGDPEVAAAGPLTNEAGHFQRIEATYTDIRNLDRFAHEFALREAEDLDTDMLVGFCLAGRREILESVGGFDEAFDVGMFEDNDLCYRLRRVGHRLRIAARSFVHHKGSSTFLREGFDVPAIFHRNHEVFEAKWRADLEYGFATHLSGLRPDRIAFDESRRPENVQAEMRALAQKADISLCMIVRDEERVIADCLSSVQDLFREIVLVDTGSVDRTREIARGLGATVVEETWPHSFAAARNESLRRASGRWIFWMDADDTLPAWSAERILRAAADAPDDVIGFVVPVQFVDEGPGTGTRVDHVKLFRNLPGVSFEGRIHEQVLPSLREIGGDVVRLDAVVMHTGYDTSAVGQAKKRKRDEELLRLDLEERPDHPFVLFNLGMTAHYCGDHEAAIDWLRKSIAAAHPEESHVRKAYALLAVSLRESGRTNEATSALNDGLAAVGPDAELGFQKGLTLTALGRYDEARAAYEEMPLDVAKHFSSLDVGILGHKRSHNLAGVLHALGRYSEAKVHWLRAMEEASGSPTSATALFEAALESRDLPAARHSVDWLYRLLGPKEPWVSAMERYAEEVGGEGNALEALALAVRANPQAVAPRLRLARRLLSSGAVEEARPYLESLQADGVAEAAFYLGVAELRVGKLDRAIVWTERAHELEPEHDGTRRQLEALWAAREEESARMGA